MVVKSCSCGNQVKFDPSEIHNIKEDLTDSDYGSFDRRQFNHGKTESNDEPGVFFAKPIHIEDSPPPRPPPPQNYQFVSPSYFYSLPRPSTFSNSLQQPLSRSQSVQQLQFGSNGAIGEFATPFDSYISKSNSQLGLAA